MTETAVVVSLVAGRLNDQHVMISCLRHWHGIIQRRSEAIPPCDALFRMARKEIEKSGTLPVDDNDYFTRATMASYMMKAIPVQYLFSKRHTYDRLDLCTDVERQVWKEIFMEAFMRRLHHCPR